MSDTPSRFDAIIQKLQDHHYKLTAQRLAVVKVLSESDGHPSVDKIYHQLKTDFPTMSLTTVYRNVMLIQSLGEVLELGFPDGSNRYDGNRPYPHPHVICMTCGKIIDPDLPGLENMAEKVAKETGFDIISHRMDFFGTCPDCSGKKPSSGIP